MPVLSFVAPAAGAGWLAALGLLSLGEHVALLASLLVMESQQEGSDTRGRCMMVIENKDSWFLWEQTLILEVVKD